MKLTGTVGPNEQQQSPIVKGKIEGDRITFESQTEGPVMHFDLRFEEGHLRGEARGQLEDIQILAKLDLERRP